MQPWESNPSKDMCGYPYLQGLLLPVTTESKDRIDSVEKQPQGLAIILRPSSGTTRHSRLARKTSHKKRAVSGGAERHNLSTQFKNQDGSILWGVI